MDAIDSKADTSMAIANESEARLQQVEQSLVGITGRVADQDAAVHRLGVKQAEMGLVQQEAARENSAGAAAGSVGQEEWQRRSATLEATCSELKQQLAVGPGGGGGH